MPNYTYVARDFTGRKVKGEIEAENERAVISHLRPRRLSVISLRRQSGLAKVGGKNLSEFSIFKPRRLLKNPLIGSLHFPVHLDLS